MIADQEVRAPHDVMGLAPGLAIAGSEAGQRQRRELLGHLGEAQPALRVVPLVGPVQHAQQAVRHDLDVEVGPELARLDALAQDLLPVAFVLLGLEVEAVPRRDLVRACGPVLPNDLSVVALRFRPVIIQLCEPSPANPDRLAGLEGKCPGIIGFAHCLD